jgi:hypothetical protein
VILSFPDRELRSHWRKFVTGRVAVGDLQLRRPVRDFEKAA